MEKSELINICERCGSYSDFLEAPDGEAWFICRRCGNTQPNIEELSIETFTQKEG
ncbi:hypothetical protein FAK_09420 [Desulfoferula mesophila]|uniref:Uncharacterized protein n=1 Tax=Desulfoferula mesophila TaxID=3058419 RepID=A0AAU9E9U9_9BACT|nr:hypothetical protein FAK_09420 [Desulfoferula mesophilus]